MHKHIPIFLNVLIFSFTSFSLTMDQKLIKRKKSNESAQQQSKNSFFNRTMQEILQEKCPVCHHKLTRKNGATTILYCQHPLHSSCFEQLKKFSQTNCPQCRNPVEQFEEQDETELEANCCVYYTEKTANALAGQIYSNIHLYIAFLKDISDPHQTWGDIYKKLNRTSEQCTDEHVPS